MGTQIGRLLSCLLFYSGIVAAQTPGTDYSAIKPGDVFQRATVFAGRLDSLRGAMGKPKVSGRVLEVENAAPREVYYQAAALHEKMNRLASQLIRTEFPALEKPQGEIRPGDVYKAIEASDQILASIGAHLKIGLAQPSAPSVEEKAPTDVFHLIQEINRQANVLLDAQNSPTDVYQVVTQCVHHTIALRRNFPGQRVETDPEFIPNQTPQDVYKVLIDCFGVIEMIAEESKVNILTIQTSREETTDIVPNDVFDLATLILSELDRLIAMHEAENTIPRKSYYPSRKFPSDVHQRARLLHAQLSELERQVREKPDWLSHP